MKSTPSVMSEAPAFRSPMPIWNSEGAASVPAKSSRGGAFSRNSISSPLVPERKSVVAAVPPPWHPMSARAPIITMNTVFFISSLPDDELGAELVIEIHGRAEDHRAERGEIRILIRYLHDLQPAETGHVLLGLQPRAGEHAAPVRLEILFRDPIIVACFLEKSASLCGLHPVRHGYPHTLYRRYPALRIQVCHFQAEIQLLAHCQRDDGGELGADQEGGRFRIVPALHVPAGIVGEHLLELRDPAIDIPLQIAQAEGLALAGASRIEIGQPAELPFQKDRK